MATRLCDFKEGVSFGANGDQLIAWLKGLRYFSPKKVHVVEYSDEKLVVKLYTDEHYYQITATAGGYLGCTASTRKPRPGESWTRGNDLPDGKFSKAVFDSIIGAIVFYEAEEVMEDIQQLADESLEAFDD